VLSTNKIDFTSADPWDWWKRGVLLEGETEVFSMRLNGAIGMPSTGQVSEIFGKGCLMLTKTPMAPAAEASRRVVLRHLLQTHHHVPEMCFCLSPTPCLPDLSPFHFPTGQEADCD